MTEPTERKRPGPPKKWGERSVQFTARLPESLYKIISEWRDPATGKVRSKSDALVAHILKARE